LTDRGVALIPKELTDRKFSMIDRSYGRIRDVAALPELLVEYAGTEGLERAFARQSIPVDLLDTPDAVLAIRDIVALYRNAAEISAIRSFGLQAARDLDITEFGAMGGFIMQAQTLRQAFNRFQVALPFYESGSALTLEEADDEFIVGYKNIYQDLPGYRQTGDMTIRMIEGVIRGYAGGNWRLRRVETCYANGTWMQDFEDAFCAPISSGNSRIALVLDRHLLDSTTRTPKIGQGELVSIAEVKALSENLPTDFPGMVINLVEQRLLTDAVNLEDISEALNLGPRTVQRRLENHGLVYRNLVLACRMRRARELLSGTAAGIDQVSQEVGYSAISHFTRAFKEANGICPSEYRRARLCYQYETLPRPT
jgi:AraC-like DNA-binding protein